MKAYGKSIARSFKTNISRFLSILLIVLVGVSFVSGIGTLPHIMRKGMSDYFYDTNTADIVLKSKSPTGFTSTEIEEILNIEEVASIRKIKIYDKDDTRLVIIDSLDNKTNEISLKEGNRVSSQNQIYSDRTTNELNQKVTLFDNNEYEVVGVVSNPLYYAKVKEYTNYKEEIHHFYYAEEAYFPLSSMLPYTDLYISLVQDTSISIYSDTYKKRVDSIAEKLETTYDVSCLTYEENQSYQLNVFYAEKLDRISWVFPIFFVLVSCLVVLTTMSRLIEEERGVIGTYRTLGYSSFKIMFKYISFSLSSCLIGAIVGIVLGVIVLPFVIYPAYEALFFMPPLIKSRSILNGVIALLVTVGSVILVTIYTSYKELKDKPAELLRPKAPKPGKKVFLEYIPFLWKPLKFRYKSSFRNVFRYVRHFLMTVVSVGGSTALVFAGFGLYNCVMDPNIESLPSSMADSFSSITIMIIIFAAVLCVLVIYNLTNMNISERNREIATLKVLGYQNPEVGFYIYREVSIMTIIGIILGIPMGYLLCDYAFGNLGIGSVDAIKPSTYFISAFLTLVFLIITDVMLYPKICKVDMNGSLKSNE